MGRAALQANGLPLTRRRLRVLGAIKAGKVRLEAGRVWDCTGGDERLVTVTVAAFEAARPVYLSQRRDQAGRQLYALTGAGERALVRASATVGGGSRG